MIVTESTAGGRAAAVRAEAGRRRRACRGLRGRARREPGGARDGHRRAVPRPRRRRPVRVDARVLGRWRALRDAWRRSTAARSGSSTARRPTRRWSTATTCCCCARPSRRDRRSRRPAAPASGPPTPATSGRRHGLAARARPRHVRVAGREVQPLLAQALGTPVATWRTEPAENTFPALPVRPDHVVRLDGHLRRPRGVRRRPHALDRHPAWLRTMTDLDARGVLAETLRLRPTARSSHPPAG